MDLIENISVSSVLNRDVKNFSKKNIFDGSDETCWHSSEGSPQWVKINFKNNVSIKGFEIQFQGGFVGKECEFANGDGEKRSVELFYPEDVNSKQKFELKNTITGKTFTFNFNSSTDFFGRIEELSVVKRYFEEKPGASIFDHLFQKQDAFRATYEQFAAVATFGCSTACCESSFSTLTSINRPLRLSMSHQRMADLIYLAFEKERTNKIDMDQFLKILNEKRDRRLQLF